MWLAVDRDRNEIAAYHVGGGRGWNAKRLIDKVKHHDIGIVATDGNYVYGRYLPKKIRHIAAKLETCLVETTNSSLREMITRFNRRTKQYSKCPIMFRQAVPMWVHQKL